jgi:hypothetical protein
MQPFRVSIAALLAVVACCAIAFAALRFASGTWAAVMLMVVLAILATAVFRAIFQRGPQRAFWLGLALFGGVSVVLLLAPWVGPRLRARLPTTRLLDQLYPHVHLDSEESATIPRGTFDESFSAWAEAHPSAVLTTLVHSSPVQIYWVTPAREAFGRIGHLILALALGVAGGVTWVCISALRKRPRRREG